MATEKVTRTKSTYKVWVRVVVASLAGLLLLIGSLGLWAKNQVFNNEQFTKHITNAIQDEQTRIAIGNSVAAKIYEDRPVLGRALTQPTANLVSSIIISDRFKSVVGELSNRLNNRLFRGHTDPVVFDVSGLTSGITAVAAIVAPEAEINLPQGEDAKITLLESDTIPNLQPVAQAVLALTPLVFLALLVIAVVSFLRINSKIALLKLTGVVLLSTGILLVVITSTAAAQLSLLGQNATQAAILSSFYDQFVASILSYQTTLIITGLVVLGIAYLLQYRKQIGSLATTVADKFRSKPTKPTKSSKA